MRLDLSGEMRVHGGFRGRTDGDGLLQIRLSALGDPCNFSGKALEMLLLTLKIVGTDEDWEVRIPNLEGLECVSEILS